MTKVFLLQHLHTLEDGEESVKIIGVYSDYDNALRAVSRIKEQPGFSDHPKLIDPDTDQDTDGFYIDSYDLNQDNWKEGFVTC